MNLNRYQELLSKIFPVLFFIILFYGCEEEKRMPVKAPPPRKDYTRHIPELSSSPLKKISFKIKKNPAAEKLDKINNKEFGINYIKKENGEIFISYNPGLITPDSIRSILERDSIL